MALGRKRVEEEPQEKVLEVNASMQGSLSFKDPVNLRINGRFEGTLDTAGSLIIGEGAEVKATIHGELIIVGGTLTGEVIATKRLELVPPGRVSGKITTPSLIVREGACIDGQIEMGRVAKGASGALVSAEEIAHYLEVDVASVVEWASSGRLPAQRDGNNWKFDRAKVDEWLAQEKTK